MGKSICIEPGCMEPVRARYLCIHHYDIRRRAGTLPEPTFLKYWLHSCPSPVRWRERIVSGSVADSTTGCWIWPRVDKNGYGRFNFKQNGVAHMTGAHRAAWLAFRGDIGGPSVIDHLCRNHACCNPSHLRVVSTSENVAAGLAGTVRGCMKHGFSEGVLDFKKNTGRAVWRCRHCDRDRYYRKQQRRLQTAA